MSDSDKDFIILLFLPYKNGLKQIFIDDKGIATDKKFIIVYDNGEDVFYAVPQRVKKRASLILYKNVFMAQIGIFLTCLIVSVWMFWFSCLCDQLISACFWKEPILFALVLIAFFFFGFYVLKQEKKRKQDKFIHNYSRSDFKKIEELQTLEQRKVFFSKYRLKIRIAKLLLVVLIIFIEIILVYPMVVASLRIMHVLAFLSLIFTEVELIYGIICLIPDKNMKYLLHKFASKGE